MEENNKQIDVITQVEPTPEELVVKIKDYMKQTRQNIIEIGKLLILAKKQVPHGEWANWLANNIDFTQNTANRFMRCTERFSNYAPAHNLNSSQMFELLALKQADTESFITSKANEGIHIETMSKKNLRDEIKKWKAEQKAPSNQGRSSAQEDSDNVTATDLKKMEQLVNLVLQLTELQNTDEIVHKFVNKNQDKVKKFLDGIQVLNNLIPNYTDN